MKNAIDLAEIAKRQLADYDAHRPGLFFCDTACELTIAQAYAVQKQVAALRAARGEGIAGYKIGCVSQVVQRQLGLDRPVFGYVFHTELHPTGVKLDPTRFENLAIEGEFAVSVAKDLPDPEDLLRQPMDAIDAVLAVVELHNNVFRGAKRTAEELIANNALHAGVVLPASTSSKDMDDRLSVFLNDEQIGAQMAAAALGGLWASVISVASHVAAIGSCLKRGDLVLTGSPLPLYPVGPGDSIMVRSGRCGEAKAIVLSNAGH